ncbi:uncharacterized protein M421DRAFT_6902, partial [Didymella exigua CBS 183.55]
MAPHKHDALCAHLHAKLQRFGEANPGRMADSEEQSKEQSQQSKEQSQQSKEQSQQSKEQSQ